MNFFLLVSIENMLNFVFLKKQHLLFENMRQDDHQK